MKFLKQLNEKLGIKIDGIAKHRDGKVMINDGNEWEVVSFNESNSGYVREVGATQIAKGEDISCSYSTQVATQTFALVFTTEKEISLATLYGAFYNALANDFDIIVMSYTNDRELIQREELLPESEWHLAKITFQIRTILETNCEKLEIC